MVQKSKQSQARAVAQCRACGAGNLETVLDLGSQPLANALVQNPAHHETRYPLAVAVCAECALVQTTYSVPGSVIFGNDYPYYSSYSTSYLSHAKASAETFIDTYSLGPHSRVIEIASNDGYLLQNFVDRGIPVLGIEPANGPAEVATASGVPTLIEYFCADLGERLRKQGEHPDVVIGNNVLAHVDDVNNVIRGVAILLGEEGVGVFEVPYLVDLVDNCAFDTIYHEHNCYFSLTALTALFHRHQLDVIEVFRLPVHGGSLRVVVKRNGERRASVSDMLAREAELGIGTLAYYRDFASRVDRTVTSLNQLLCELKRDGKRIAAYGAAAKGAVLGNAACLGRDLIDYVVDRNPKKQDRFMPGIGVPIVSPEFLREQPPDYLLLFVWNLADEIQTQLTDFSGRLIVPIPTPRIV